MKKQGKHFIILLAVVAVLGILYICLAQYNKGQQNKETDQDEKELLVDIARDDIIRLSYVHEGETYVFEKVTASAKVSQEQAENGAQPDNNTDGVQESGEDGSTDGAQESGEDGSTDGVQESGEDGNADGQPPQEESRWVFAEDPSLNIIQSRLDTMAGRLNHVAAQNIFANVTDLAQYGLAEPSNVLHWETADASYTFNVGDYNSLGNVYYICEPGSATVYVVEASVATGFDYSLEDLTEQE